MLDRLKGLARRARDKVGGSPQAKVGSGFGPEHDRAFAALHDEVEGGFALVGSAVVASWEVLLTDLGRALKDRLPEEERAALVERTSDALVPTQGAFQGTGRKLQHAVQTGTRAALAQGRLDVAVGPLGAILGAMPGEVAAGWGKTVDFLWPLCTRLDPSGALQRALLAQGSGLAQELEAAHRAFASAMAGLPEAQELQPALLAAFEAWHRSVARTVEGWFYERRGQLVAAAEALPR